MKTLEASEALRKCDKIGKYVFSINDLRKLFGNDTEKTFNQGLRRLVANGLLIRAMYGVYVNPNAHSFDSYTIERIAKTLRRAEYNYISLESMLSDYGAISQIMVDRLTIMTTGRSGTYHTPYGTIEFTHTNRSAKDILNSIQTIEGRPLRIATKKTAWRDLKRVGRNINMVDQEIIDEN